jgi:hypothetical protein
VVVASEPDEALCARRLGGRRRSSSVAFFSLSLSSTASHISPVLSGVFAQIKSTRTPGGTCRPAPNSPRSSKTVCSSSSIFSSSFCATFSFSSSAEEKQNVGNYGIITQRSRSEKTTGRCTSSRFSECLLFVDQFLTQSEQARAFIESGTLFEFLDFCFQRVDMHLVLVY